MHEKGRLSCARCCASYPNVSILKCDNTILGISLTMCKTCHKRFHPTCDYHTSAIRPEDRVCDRCFQNEAVIVCPQCSGISLTMCKTCHKRFHPTCDYHTSAIRPEDRVCDRCFQNEAVIVCPQCSGPSYCAQLCKSCHHTVHKDHLFSHIDHIVKIPL